MKQISITEAQVRELKLAIKERGKMLAALATKLLKEQQNEAVLDVKKSIDSLDAIMKQF